MDLEDAKKLIPEEDVAFLSEKGYSFDILKNGNDVLVTLHKFPLPDVYEPNIVDLRVVLGPGYPNANPDMFWTSPWVKLKTTGADPQNSSEAAAYPDGQWQRWSRHYESGWRPGIDGLRAFLASIRSELNRQV
jgi:hypothetical protein